MVFEILLARCTCNLNQRLEPSVKKTGYYIKSKVIVLIVVSDQGFKKINKIGYQCHQYGKNIERHQIHDSKLCVVIQKITCIVELDEL